MAVCCRCVLHRLCSTTCMRPCIEPLGVLSRHPCRNPKPLPLGERLCMLGWLCICAIVVVCCWCVLHRLCSTTCMRPCIEPFGIHARHPCQSYFAGATAPRPCRGLRPCDPISIFTRGLSTDCNRSVMQGGFCCIEKPTVHIVNFTQTHYKISQQNYKKVFKKAKV